MKSDYFSSANLKSEDDEENLPNESLLEHEWEPQHKRQTPLDSIIRFLPWILHLILLSVAGGMLITSVNLKNSIPQTYQKENAKWAIAMGSIPDKHTDTRFDGNLASFSPYKGPPTVAVEKAWNKLTQFGAMRISEEVYEQLNASKHAVKIPSDLGGGRLALYESVHYIHCVQALWESTYPDYYTKKALYAQEHPEAWHEHMDHCADILRQKLMCDADVRIITYNWIKGHVAPYPNFNVQYQCRDFDVVLKNAMDNRIASPAYPKGYFLRPADEPWVEFDEPPMDPMANE